MKIRLFALMLLLSLLGAALAEEDVYVLGDYYHSTPLCAATRQSDPWEYARLSKQSEGEGETAEAAGKLRDAYFRTVSLNAALMWGYAPCPVCVGDETDYGDPCAVERGGTAVLRVSDKWIQSRERFDALGTAGDDVFEGEAATKELARILHGEAYEAFLNQIMQRGGAEAEVLCPDLYEDDGLLVMHARHIGGAWYLTFRPGEAGRKRMKADGRIDVEACLNGGSIRWADGTLTEVSWGHHWEETLALKLGAISGKPAFSGDFENLAVTLFREMDANILVIRESPGDGAWLGAVLTLDDRLAADGLTGYMDGGDAVYVCVLADVEAEALKGGAFPRLIHPGRVTGEIVATDGWRLDTAYAYTVFFRDGALYVTNNTDAECRPITVRFTASEGAGTNDRRLDAVPLGKTVLVYSAGDVDYRANGAGELVAWADLTLGDGGEVISNYDRVRGSYEDGKLVWTRATTDEAVNDDWRFDAAASDGPAPGRDLSFLSNYCDAQQVGDWYLACTERTAEGRYDEATRNDSAEWWLLDGDGNAIVKGLYWWPKDDDWPIQPRPFEGFTDGVDTAVIRIGQKYGLINRAGEIVVEAKYDDIFGFEPGDRLTPVELDGKWGAIDEVGNEVVPIVYDSPFSRFADGVTVAERGGKCCLVGEDGTEILPAEYSTIWLDDGAEYGFARKGATGMLFDRAGNILFEKKLGENGWIYVYADATPPFAWDNGDDETHGYCGLDGVDIPGGPYEDTDPFWGESATASVQVDGHWGEVDREGNIVVETEYQWVGGYSEGLCPAQAMDGLYGCLDDEGDVAVPFEFGDIRGFKNGYSDASPKDDTAYHGLIDRTGKWVIEPKYTECVAVGDDGVAVGLGGGKMEFYQLTVNGAKRIEGLFTGWNDWLDGLLPNADGGRLAALDEAPALEKRVSDQRLPHLDGDRRLYPLYAAYVQAIYPKDTVYYEAWDSYREDGNPILTCTGAETAWQRLSDGDADVIFVPAPEGDDPIWATLAARGQAAEFTPLCMDAVVFPVGAANPVSDVSVTRLKQVYSGLITDWSTLGAAGLGNIVAYQSREDEYNNPARDAFEKLCAFENLMPPAEGVIGFEGFAPDVATGPADYRNLPNAIGYALRSECLELVDDNMIKLLSVNGVTPTDDNIAGGAYPYAETLYAVTLKGNDNPNVIAFMDWIKSKQGMELAENTGFAATEVKVQSGR